MICALFANAATFDAITNGLLSPLLHIHYSLSRVVVQEFPSWYVQQAAATARRHDRPMLHILALNWKIGHILNSFGNILTLVVAQA